MWPPNPNFSWHIIIHDAWSPCLVKLHSTTSCSWFIHVEFLVVFLFTMLMIIDSSVWFMKVVVQHILILSKSFVSWLSLECHSWLIQSVSYPFHFVPIPVQNPFIHIKTSNSFQEPFSSNTNPSSFKWRNVIHYMIIKGSLHGKNAKEEVLTNIGLFGQQLTFWSTLTKVNLIPQLPKTLYPQSQFWFRSQS